MSSFLTVNEINFPEQVLKASIPVIVEFGAVWCAPCKHLEPIMEKLGDEWGSKVRLVKIDVDESVNVAITCEVMRVPTLILFVQGQEKQRLTGLQPRERIVEKFTPYF
jgi:thioredoxin 1